MKLCTVNEKEQFCFNVRHTYVHVNRCNKLLIICQKNKLYTNCHDSSVWFIECQWSITKNMFSTVHPDTFSAQSSRDDEVDEHLQLQRRLLVISSIACIIQNRLKFRRRDPRGVRSLQNFPQHLADGSGFLSRIAYLAASLSQAAALMRASLSRSAAATRASLSRTAASRSNSFVFVASATFSSMTTCHSGTDRRLGHLGILETWARASVLVFVLCDVCAAL